MNLLRQLPIEHKKHKGRYNFVIILGIILIEMLFIYANYKGEKGLLDGWMILFYNMPIMNSLFLPVVISTFASRLMDIEHKGDMLKNIYTFSSRKSVFFTKVVYGLIQICILVTMQCAAILLMAKIMHFPLTFQIKYLLYYGLNTFMSCTMLFFLQILLAYFFKNQAVPISVGLIGSFMGLFCAYLPTSLFQKMLPWSTFVNGLFIGMDWNRETRDVRWFLLDLSIEPVLCNIIWVIIFVVIAILFLRRSEIEQKEHMIRSRQILSTIRIHKRPVEIMKLKGSPSWFAFFIIPILSALIGTLNYLGNIEILTDGWFSLWTQHTLFLCYFFMPVIIAVFEGCIWRLEHHGTNMNLLLTHTSPAKIVLSKFVASIFITTLSLVWIVILYLLSGLFCHMTGSLPSELITWLALGLIGAYAINAVQLFLSLIIRNFVLPIILAFIGGITGLVFIAKDIPYFLPYSLFALGMTEYNTTLNLPLFLICSLIFIGLFLLLSVIYLLFTDTCSQK